MYCIPPTLSDKNRCTGIIKNSTILDYLNNKYYIKYIAPKTHYKLNAAELECPQPCQIMENYVHLVESTPINVHATPFEKPTITLRFLDTVKFRKKVRITFFNTYQGGGH